MFNDKEQRGILVFIALMLGFVIFKSYNQINTVPSRDENYEYPDMKLTPLKDLLSKSNNASIKVVESEKPSMDIKLNKRLAKRKSRENRLFSFNPNTISRDSLVMLGLNSKVIYNWMKYIDKGGKFKSKKDLKKIYGLTEKSFNKIEKYIMLPDSILYIRSEKKDVKKGFKYKNKKSKRYENLVIELNSCSEDDLKKLFGIGEVLSKRIIKFRDKLGGYYSLEQVSEVYGLSTETYERIKPHLEINKDKLKKIKINFADQKQLAGFPYISYRLASQIVKYRRQHGSFIDLKDLLKIKTIDEETLIKITPYLDFEFE